MTHLIQIWSRPVSHWASSKKKIVLTIARLGLFDAVAKTAGEICGKLKENGLKAPFMTRATFQSNNVKKKCVHRAWLVTAAVLIAIQQSSGSSRSQSSRFERVKLVNWLFFFFASVFLLRPRTGFKKPLPLISFSTEDSRRENTREFSAIARKIACDSDESLWDRLGSENRLHNELTTAAIHHCVPLALTFNWSWERERRENLAGFLLFPVRVCFLLKS